MNVIQKAAAKYILGKDNPVESLKIGNELLQMVANRDSAAITKAKNITVDLAIQARQLTAKDVGLWRAAHQIALDVERPDRTALYGIYADVLLDAHLKGAIRNRKLQVIKKKFKIVDSSTGAEDIEKTKLLKKKWFRKFVSLSLDATFKGHVLIQFGDLYDGQFKFITEVPRNHVIPEKGIVVKQLGDETGIDFRNGGFTDWTIEVGEPDDLGLLLEACPHAISKKNMAAFWDEFGEIFGIPIRIGKYSTHDEKQIDKIESMLKDMGSNSWANFPDGVDIEIKESKNKDSYMVFDKRIDRSNSELSKLIIGQTMTMDDGSSMSQAKVHENVADDITDDDAENIKSVVNDDLLPLLIKHGYKFSDNDEFVWDDKNEISLKDQKDIDSWLLNEGFEIDEDYFKEKYNPRITGRTKPTEPKPNSAGGGGVGKS